jgi:hypothetical protein
MVKHVESTDEFDALKKASKPVRPFILSFFSPRRSARCDRSSSLSTSEVFLSRSLFVIFPQPTFKKEKNETHFARAMKSNEERPLSFPRREKEKRIILSLFFSLVS